MHRVTSILAAALAVSGAAHAGFTVDLGLVKQVSPRPSIEYAGQYGAAVTSFADATGARTVTRFDLGKIAEMLGGGLALTEVRVRDSGLNSYGNYSPGADVDLLRVVGLPSDGSVEMRYSGAVAQHLGESSATLLARVADLDAISGDQHFNSQHFISLGSGGVASMLFSGFLISDGSSGGGSGGGDGSGSSLGGPGSYTGGGTPPTYGGLLLGSGLALEIGEAGLGEGYGVSLVFEQVAVPAPGAVALLLTAGFVARRRRR